MAPTPERPRQVTFVGWMIMIGSAVVVFSAFERISGLHTIESQESVANFLSEPPGDGLGWTVDQGLELIRLLSLVAGACAAAAAILGFWVLKGSKQARLGLAVLAVPLLVTGLATGGFVSSLVAVSAVLLWLQPARNWFEGRPAPDPSGPHAGPHGGPRQDPSVARPVAAPPPVQTEPVPWPTPYGTPQKPQRRARPPAVVWACVLTWIGCGIVVVALGATVLVMLASPDLLFEELHRQNPDLAEQGLTDSEIRTASLASAVVLLPWCLVAAGLAIQAFRGLPWARRALLISAAVAGAVSLLGMLASAVMVVPFVATVVTVALLSRPEVRAWFAA